MVLKFRYVIHKRLVFMEDTSLHSVVILHYRTVNTLQPIGCSNYCVHIRLCISNIDDLITAAYTGDDNTSLRLFYTTAHSLMMDQSGPKHVRVFKLKH
jgi:hypothetical protein